MVEAEALTPKGSNSNCLMTCGVFFQPLQGCVLLCASDTTGFTPARAGAYNLTPSGVMILAVWIS